MNKILRSNYFIFHFLMEFLSKKTNQKMDFSYNKEKQNELKLDKNNSTPNPKRKCSENNEDLRLKVTKSMKRREYVIYCYSKEKENLLTKPKLKSEKQWKKPLS